MSVLGDYYFHPAWYPSRWGVIDVGLRCVHSCSFCFYLYMDGSDDPTAGMRHAKFHSRDHLLTLANSLADNCFVGTDITGGEPTLHPNIVDIIGRLSERGVASRVITLGQYLLRPMHKLKGNLIDELLAAGLTDFRLSVHECAEDEFKVLTGGSWAKQKSNMDYLDNKNFQYMTNTTVNLKNYQRLPLIAKEISKHNVYNSTLLFMMAHYQWSLNGHAKEIQCRYTDAAKYAREFVSILEDAKIPVIARYAPLCTIAGLERNHVGALGVRYDPHEWMNQIDHKADPSAITQETSRQMGDRLRMAPGQPSDGLQLVQEYLGIIGESSIIGGRGSRGHFAKVYPTQCNGCSASGVCDGVELQYIERFGGEEFIPYRGINRGAVLDIERVAYRPAFFVKTKATADIKTPIARSFVTEPINSSPLVSVIVTCFNYGKYLRECLYSIAAQAYRDWELIFVDDRSTDDSWEIASEGSFPSGTFLRAMIRMEKNSGQPAITRNRGISASFGDLILCVDADDVLKPTMIEECVEAFKANPQASIVYTGVTCFGEGNDEWNAAPFDYGLLIQKNYIPYCSMYRRSVWDDVGGYKTYVRGSEDWNFWIQAAGLGHIAVPLPRQLWKYRVHKDGIFHTDVVPNFEEKRRAIIINNPHLYPARMVIAARENQPIPSVME